MQSLKVAKFGGSSMGDHVSMLRSANIVKTHSSQLIVVSATYGTTNLLEHLMELSKGSSYEIVDQTISKLKDKHLEICNQLELESIYVEKINQIITELSTLIKGTFYLNEITPRAKDRIYSTGERLSSTLFQGCLQSVLGNQFDVDYVDARDFLITDAQFNKAKPIINEIEQRSAIIRDKLINNPNQYFVTQGFIGKTIEGETTTLGRGGSDYSASIFAEAINAAEIQIWTDVAGIATTDPRICTTAKIIHEITFKEAAEMAIFGAKILHPTTLVPARRASIPVYVGSSFDSDAPGTWIKENCDYKPLVRGITKKDDQGLITISNPHMAHAHGFLAKIFVVFQSHDVSVDAITTSEISVAMTIDMIHLSNQSFIKNLEEMGKIRIERDYSLVSIIGNKINTTPGIANKIFNGLGATNVRMICQGASVHNFCVLVDQNQGETTVKNLHQTFIQ